MKTQTFLYTALAALTLSACADGNDLTADYTNTMNNNTAAEQPIEFGTYVGKSGTTRTGQTAATGSIANNTTLQAATHGFGVFAYYTEDENYDTNPHSAVGTAVGFTGNTSHKANFMFNERVFYNTDHWEYWPLKFWPNDNTTADNAGATGITSSKVSFFAYAPYDGNDDDASFSPTNNNGASDQTGAASSNATGITNLYTSSSSTLDASGTKAAGDPLVAYKLATTGKQVDLLWGTANSIYNSAAGADTQDRTSNTYKTRWYDTSITWGYSQYPLNIDLTKPWVTNNSTTSTDKITFNFKHALAKVGGSLEESNSSKWNTPNIAGGFGGLMVVLDIDNNGTITGGAKPNETKVTIKQISIENVNGGLATTDPSFVDYSGSGNSIDDQIIGNGVFNLATGRWTLGSQTVSISHVIESPASSVDLNTALTAAATAKGSALTIAEMNSEAGKLTTINAAIHAALAEPENVTAGVAGWEALPDGVLTAPRNVYGAETDPLVFIPGTTPWFKITIEYVVRTKDAKLERGYSEVAQKISKYVSFTLSKDVNKKYTVLMRLGLTSVKFSASVDDWEEPELIWTDSNGDGIMDDSEVTGGGTKTDVNLPINVTPAP